MDRFVEQPRSQMGMRIRPSNMNSSLRRPNVDGAELGTKLGCDDSSFVTLGVVGGVVGGT